MTAQQGQSAATDPDIEVRVSVAHNPALPAHLQILLAADVVAVKESLRRNPALTDEARKALDAETPMPAE
jgi:hypothetical protein